MEGQLPVGFNELFVYGHQLILQTPYLSELFVYGHHLILQTPYPFSLLELLTKCHKLDRIWGFNVCIVK